MHITKPTSLLLFITIITILPGCKDHRAPNLNLYSKNAIPEIFAEGLISTPLYERDIAINAQGDEIIYTIGDYKQLYRCLVSIRNIDGQWSAPTILNFSGEYQDIEPFLANNDQRLYFASNRPTDTDDKLPDYNIWYSDKLTKGWGNPVALNELINTDKDEFYPSLSANGNLYFTATRSDGIGREDIFISKFENNEFQKPIALDSNINTSLFEFNAFINSEEDLLIFSSYGRTDDLGGGDLYYSKKDTNGNWTPSKNMGQRVNSDKLDYCPFIDLQRNVLYFTSERLAPNVERLSSVTHLSEVANSCQNGMGDIYSISTDSLFVD